MSNDREIVIRLKADGTAEVVDALKQTEAGVKATGKTADDTGKTTEKAGLAGKTAFWGLGQAAEELGRKVGITGQENRRLGEVVEKLSSSVPVLASAFGGLTLGLGAVATVYGHLIEQKKLLDQETIASQKGRLDEIISMDLSWRASDRMKNTLYEIYLQKRQNAIQSTETSIPAMRREIIELVESQQKIGGVIDRLKQLSTWWLVLNPFAKNTMVEDEAQRQTIAMTAIIDKAQILNKTLVMLNDVKKRGPASREDILGVDDKLWDETMSRFKEMSDARINANLVIADSDRRSFELAQAKGLDMEKILQRELVAFDAMTRLKLSAAKDVDESGKILRDREAEREILLLQRTQDNEKKRLDIVTAAARQRAEYSLATGSENYEMDELQAYNSETAMLMNAAKDRKSQMIIWKTRELQFNQRINTQKAAMDRQLMSLQLNTVSTGLQAIDTITKGKYKGIFYSIQAMAAAQAVIHGEAAAAAAIAPPPIGLGPVAGTGLAAWSRAQGYASAALILAQTFAGGGGRGGAVGTYSANPGTGMPEYKYFDYESSRYGTGWRPGENQNRGAGQSTVINIQNVQAWDSKDVKKFLMENAGAVKAVNKEISGGYI